MSKNSERNTLYVATDQSLDPIYAAVQAGHAVAQWLLENPDQDWNNEYLIYLTGDIERVRDRLDLRLVPYSSFYEPDVDRVTALATREPLKLKLLGT